MIKIFVFEERKKGIQKKIGELRISVYSLPKNEKTESWFPLTGDKAKTVGDVRLKLCYTVCLHFLKLDYFPNNLNEPLTTG